MLYYDRIDVSEGIDINKTSAWKECNICRYWYFLNKRFTFQPYICNGCNDVLMISMNLRNIVILNIRSVDYRFIITWIRKGEAVNLLRKAELNKSSATL